MRLGALCAGTAVAAAFASPALAVQDPPPVPPEEESLTWSDLLKTKSMFKFYGYIRVDAQYNDSRFNDPQIPGYVRSEDPNPPGGVPGGVVAMEDDDEFALHPRLTRFGVNLEGPRASALGDAKVSGNVEIDFYNIGLPDSDSRQAIRMRRGFVKLAWDRWSLLAGQEWDLISPLFPAVNSDLVMWGAGNTGDRRPQVRLTYDSPAGEGKFSAAVALGLTGAVSGVNVLGGLQSGENSGRPMVSARLGYQTAGGIGVGVWAHDAEEDYNAGTGEMAFDSSSVGVDVNVPFNGGNTWIKGEYWTGENLDDVRGGIFQGVNSMGMEIDADGGFVEVGHKLTSSLSAHVGVSVDDPDDDDLDPFGRSKNSIAYGTLVWNYGDVKFGLEYLNWETDYINLASGDANRVVGWISYSF